MRNRVSLAEIFKFGGGRWEIEGGGVEEDAGGGWWRRFADGLNGSVAGSYCRFGINGASIKNGTGSN